jgi:macrolide-specific efflux system membrane fusion protein
VAAIVAVAAGIGGWIAVQAPAKKETVRTVTVSRGTVERTVPASGVIQSAALVSVGAEVSGTVKTLKVKLGDKVKSGDVIAELDSLNQENAVKAAQASLANIDAQKALQQASLTKAQSALDRAKQLRAQQLMSDADYQTADLAVTTAQAQLKSIEAQIQQAQLAVDAAQLNLSRTTITAPMDGTVVSVEVVVGQAVNAASSTPTIVKLADLDNMVVKAEISEADVPLVEPGQKVYFTILGEPTRKIEATLRSVEPAPDSISDSNTTSSSSSAVYYNGLFDVPNPDGKLRIDMTAQVTIVLAEADNVLTVPASVLSRGPGGKYTVKLWNAQTQLAQVQPIEVGLNNKVTAEIVSGLSEGDLVVASGTGSSGVSATATASAGGGPGLLGGGPPGGFR